MITYQLILYVFPSTIVLFSLSSLLGMLHLNSTFSCHNRFLYLSFIFPPLSHTFFFFVISLDDSLNESPKCVDESRHTFPVLSHSIIVVVVGCLAALPHPAAAWGPFQGSFVKVQLSAVPLPLLLRTTFPGVSQLSPWCLSLGRF